AGDTTAAYAGSRRVEAPSEAQIQQAIASHTEPFLSDGGEDIFQIREEIEGAMWDGAGVVRDHSGLEATQAVIDECTERLGHVTIPAVRESNHAWQEWLDVRNILDVARLTCASALARTESRGSHFRSDYPERDDEHWLRNVLVQRGGENEPPRIWAEPVRFTRLSPP
ncbi:MAG: succinate dehydrogenase/fumarate reductase flavoprotein subunit, partial [Dehalococcoidia bacterium]